MTSLNKIYGLVLHFVIITFLDHCRRCCCINWVLNIYEVSIGIVLYTCDKPIYYHSENLTKSSCHICRIRTPGALILNHLQEAKTTEKSWSLTINSKFNAICCFNAAVLHLNKEAVFWYFEEKTKKPFCPKVTVPRAALKARPQRHPVSYSNPFWKTKKCKQLNLALQGVQGQTFMF